MRSLFTSKHQTLTLFALAIAICLAGTSLIALGDHRVGLFWMAVVAVGVGLTIVGIIILRYMLIAGLGQKKNPNR